MRLPRRGERNNRPVPSTVERQKGCGNRGDTFPIKETGGMENLADEIVREKERLNKGHMKVTNQSAMKEREENRVDPQSSKVPRKGHPFPSEALVGDRARVQGVAQDTRYIGFPPHCCDKNLQGNVRGKGSQA